MRVAHDFWLLATSQDDAICMLEILAQQFAEICFIFNIKKIKVLSTQVHDLYHVVLRDDSHMNVIAEFKCLEG